jgi:hypothetical protein
MHVLWWQLSLVDLINAEVIEPGQELAFRRNPRLTAVVTANGGLAIDGVEYWTPSSAAKVASGGVSKNGWKEWYARDRAHWVSLARLRGEVARLREEEEEREALREEEDVRIAFVRRLRQQQMSSRSA